MADQEQTRDVEALKVADAVDLHQTVREQGESEMERPAESLFWSAVAGGLAITASLLAEGAIHLALPDEPWRPLVAAIGYPFGFLIVVLGRMQLFTESTITAMLPLVHNPSARAVWRTIRLWTVVLIGNLLGVALVAWLISAGLMGSRPLLEAMVAVSSRIGELGVLETFVNAVPAGFFIAILAWTLPNARDQAFLVISLITLLVAVAGFSHSVVGSAEAFLLLFTGHMDLGRMASGFIIPAVLGNLVGGAGIFTLLAHGQVRSEING